MNWISSYNFYKICQQEIPNINTSEEFYIFLISLTKPYFPNIYWLGNKIYPPQPSNFLKERKQNTENNINLILCNHQSDLDQLIILHTLNVKYNATNNINIVKPIFFINEQFSHLPGIGDKIRDFCITLKKGDDEEKINKKILVFDKLGYNTFILFPEGQFLTKKSLQKSKNYIQNIQNNQDKQNEKDNQDKNMNNVLYPHFKAYNAFINHFKSRLTYIIDLTIYYQPLPFKHPNNSNHLNRREGILSSNPNGSYWLYPNFASIFTTFSDNKYPSPTLLVEIYKTKNYKNLTNDWLVNLWLRKNKMLEFISSKYTKSKKSTKE